MNYLGISKVNLINKKDAPAVFQLGRYQGFSKTIKKQKWWHGYIYK